MQLTRRQMLTVTAGVAGMAVIGLPFDFALAAVEDTEKAIMDFTGGKKPETGKITLTAPEIAENGNTVPVSISVDSAMSGDDMVDSVIIFAEGNPNPQVATFRFSELSGSAEATTRMRLAKTQNVMAVAKMKDGSVFIDTKQVKVTIGGCGG